jgi:hypothetical protein
MRRVSSVGGHALDIPLTVSLRRRYVTRIARSELAAAIVPPPGGQGHMPR